MLIKVGNTYLDLEPGTEVTMEKQSKLFEQISKTQGDWSYSFTLPNTSHNRATLGSPAVNTSGKTIYKNVFSDLIDDDGVTLYKGQLRVQRVTKNQIECSFFSGNYNWISLVTGSLSELDFSQYDIELNESNIINSMVNTDGINFPVIDTGGIITRGFRNFVVEDFSAGLYVKTIFRKIFNSLGIKLQGELLNDFLFNNMMVFKNGKSPSEIEAKSCYVEKSSPTSRPSENVPVKMTFQNDSSYPYYDGVDNCFDLANSKYVAPTPMLVTVEATFIPAIIDSSYNNRIQLYINGAFTFVDVGYDVGGLYNSATPGERANFTLKRTIFLDEGDELEIYTEWQQSLGSTANDVNSGTLKITPIFLYQVYGNALVPSWSKQQFVSNILNLFNIVSDFNPYTKTVTLNLFDKIKSKPSIDISNYIDASTIQTDFEEFISNYGKKNTFKYAEPEDEELRDYNVTNVVKYGDGIIEVENDFIQESADIISSDFSSPISYVNDVFGCSMERMKIFEFEETESIEFTSVTDQGGNARFVIPSNPFQQLDLVRISESTNPEYNGDWIINANSTTFVHMQGCEFKSSATGKITGIRHKYTENDDVFLLVNIPFYSVPDFSENALLFVEENSYGNLSYGYFNILNMGNGVNTALPQSLSFGSIDKMLSYQRTLLETYWSNTGSILNDPVKVKCAAHFPKAVFKSLTPLAPVYLKSEEATGLFYINRISGYRASYLPCVVELIKL